MAHNTTTHRLGARQAIRDSVRFVLRASALFLLAKSAYLVILAVTLVFVGTLLTTESLADFEQRAMTRLFVLAALDTLIGARLISRARGEATARAEAPADHEPAVSETTAPFLRGLPRVPELAIRRRRGISRPWIPTTTDRRSAS